MTIKTAGLQLSHGSKLHLTFLHSTPSHPTYSNTPPTPLSLKQKKHTKAYIDVVDTSGAGVSLLGGSPGGAILPVQMRQFKSNR